MWFSILAASLAIMLAACTPNAENTTVQYSALDFKVYHSDGNPPGQIGDIVEFDLIQKIGDSILANTFILPSYRARVLLDIPQFQGDYMEGLSMIGPGDSASFWVPVDSIYRNTLPVGINAGSKMEFLVKLHSTWNEDDLIDGLIKQIRSNRKDSIDMISLSSGLRIIWDKRGTGKTVDFGDTLSMHIKGLFVDGIPFMSTHGKSPISFVAGEGQVVPAAWDEASLHLRYGDMATLIVPFSLGFGSRDAPPVLKYSTLVYEIDLLE